MRQGKTDISVLLVPDSSISHFGRMLPHAALMNSNREQHPSAPVSAGSACW